jgi:hypothetical protein
MSGLDLTTRWDVELNRTTRGFKFTLRNGVRYPQRLLYEATRTKRPMRPERMGAAVGKIYGIACFPATPCPRQVGGDQILALMHRWRAIGISGKQYASVTEQRRRGARECIDATGNDGMPNDARHHCAKRCRFVRIAGVAIATKFIIWWRISDIKVSAECNGCNDDHGNRRTGSSAHSST